MCDTMVALPNSTYDKSLIFGKNSDREPNEPQIIVRIPEKKYERGSMVRCTYIEVPQVEKTHGVILVKPNWIWGAEMGVNEKGVVIGNEAVFTKEKVEKRALLGMDMLRLALERCSTAKEAVNCITDLLEKYGQGGKAGYTSSLNYHNSFIIADFNEAYVLETAGRHWVVDKIKDVYSISNALSIRDTYESCSKDLVTNAIEKGWCKDKNKINFKECYQDKLYLMATQGDTRQEITETSLRRQLGAITKEIIINILRDHGEQEKVKNFRSGSMKSVCMHGGGIVSSQTTGSLVVQLKNNDIELWSTGTSLPCISLFKPMWFTSDCSSFFTIADSDKAVEYWKEIEHFHRDILSGQIGNIDNFKTKRDELEGNLIGMARKADTNEDKVRIMKLSYQLERELINSVLEDSKQSKDINRVNVSGRGLYYQYYWKKQNNNM